VSVALILSLAARISIIGAIAFAVSSLRRNASAAERHLIWMLSMVSMIVLPVALVMLPALRLIPVQVAQSDAAISIQSPDARWPLALWILGTAIYLLRLAVSHIRARRIAERSSAIERWTRETGIAVRISDDAQFTFTCGIVKPVIVLDAKALTWSDELTRATLLHEAAHVHRGDVAWLLLSQLCTAMYWWHPVVWLVSRQAGVERERACDDAVLLAGVSALEYGSHLASNATVRTVANRHLAAAMLSHGNGLKGRIANLLDARANHSPLRRRNAIAASASAAIVIVLTASTSQVMSNTPIPVAPVVITPAVQLPATPPPSPSELKHKTATRKSKRRPATAGILHRPAAQPDSLTGMPVRRMAIVAERMGKVAQRMAVLAATVARTDSLGQGKRR
jgi:beta-lactamase regulating signal transducer with metallopeptidase domain